MKERETENENRIECSKISSAKQKKETNVYVVSKRNLNISKMCALLKFSIIMKKICGNSLV